MARYSNLALKDHLRESYIFNYRLIVAAIFAGILTLVLIARMVFLQIASVEHYSTLSENNRVNILPIPPTRGLIYDRNGVLLAQNLPSFTLTLIPERIKDMQATLEKLQTLVALTETDIERFDKNRKRKRRFEGIPLRYRLTDAEVARVAVEQYRMPGVEIQAELSRHYPNGKLASHAVGYVGRINERELQRLDESNYSATSHIGKVGIEKYYEDTLHGQVGYQRVETNADGRILHVIERTLPKPGKNIYLNLDIRLQAIAEQSFGEDNGALVAIDPRNGAVLAFVSMPTYDPNLFVNGIDTETYKALTNSSSQPLFNRALRGQYPPGSTLKPFIGLAGLELDAVMPEESVKCTGYYMLKNDERRYRDWKKEGHGKTDLNTAITESCDVYFYALAAELNIDRMHQYLNYFGLGKRTGIDIRGELPGLLPSREWKRRVHNLPWFPGETLISGIGQGFMLSTPLQLANITASIGTYGKTYRPSLVYATEDPTSNEVEVKNSEFVSQVPVANKANWQTVLDAMENVVHGLHGTARRIGYDAKYKIAGKTGTAQVFGIKQDEEYVEEDIEKKLRDHALFIGYAPYEDPRIAVATIVENGGSGGAVAAPIARKVMDAYLLKQPDKQTGKAGK